MRTLAFWDCPTGLSGDMCLGALVSAGVPLTYLQENLAQLNLPEIVELQQSVVHKNGIAATKVDVVLPHETDAATVHPPVRHLHDIKQIITSASLPEPVVAWSLAIFQRLAIAEGSVHGIAPETVHFHEVGATDAIVDIVGTCLGLNWLGIDELHCAPLPTGGGTIRAAHGRLPVPAPAVLALMMMAQVPIYSTGLQGELVTPTGAAIATELATHFGNPPSMRLHKVGLGAGNKDFALPNILRLWIGEAMADSAQKHPHPVPHGHPAQEVTPQSLSHKHDGSHNSATPNIEQRQGIEMVTVLETQVDDLSPQAIGYLYDRLFEAGALDVFTQTVMMKKSRPGHLITVIVYPPQAESCERVLLQETTTLGVRRMMQNRLRLRRDVIPLETPLGTVRMKLAFQPNQDVPFKAHPEYEDCATLARHHQLPWRDVHNQALCHWQRQESKRVGE
ncbi:nickel pincer cofactor biosynthesis protein LarC [Oscillatoria sp. CS-180]|uniref:nickel pincer cofactor biosynthesis protein LarC n=1 Tax=Oscillatoria sp. CS-180 TaxID=3021720 RepID=UPI0023312B93|nr:nickel pincer cofactor biosynthesis protein LarC [Oscillatoria sp. CS-180]MDB9525817.1 nickel pincer cofactor biosynthesis protein LarC [Oscillatoria sp. CS-180]